MSEGFYARSVHEVARDLVGCVVRHGDAAGRIVEVESYHESEPACHAFAGLTPRTSTLFGPPGRAYVYRSYGIHALLNAVAEREGVGAAVLIRALEPIEGLDGMRARRGLERAEDLCSGPGKLTQALGHRARAERQLADRRADRDRAAGRPGRRRRASCSARGSASPRRPSCRGASATPDSRCVSRPWPEPMRAARRAAGAA